LSSVFSKKSKKSEKKLFFLIFHAKKTEKGELPASGGFAMVKLGVPLARERKEIIVIVAKEATCACS